MRRTIAKVAADLNLLDDMTLELEHAEALTDHLAARLSALIREHRECYALSLIAEQIRAKHSRIRTKARELGAIFTSGGAK